MTPTAPKAAEPFVGPFKIERIDEPDGDIAYEVWGNRPGDRVARYIHDDVDGDAKSKAQWLCARLNASIPQADAKRAAEEIAEGILAGIEQTTGHDIHTDPEIIVSEVAAIISRHIPQAAQDGDAVERNSRDARLWKRYEYVPQDDW